MKERMASHATVSMELLLQQLQINGCISTNRCTNRILTNKEIYVSVKKPTIIETIRLNRLCWFGHVQRMEGNRIPKRVLYMNLGTIRLRGRPRNRWQDEVREDGTIVGGEGWQEKVHNREEWRKLLRMARNRRILHMSVGRMNEMHKHVTHVTQDLFK